MQTLPRLIVIAAVALTGCSDDAPSSGRAPDTAAAASSPWFTDITSDSGLDFRTETGAASAYYMPEIMGGGACLFDFDGDGDLDAYLIGGHTALPSIEPVTAPANRLFRREASGRYADVTASSGLGCGAYGMGATAGDIDNDGFLDLFVTSYGSARLYRNRGDGTFEDATAAWNVRIDGWSCSSAFFDYDRDGWLDLYVTRYVEYDPAKHCSSRAGKRDYCTPKAFAAMHDVLLHNEPVAASGGAGGARRFVDVSDRAGVTAVPAAAGLGVVCADLDDDGWIDVYVANDGHPNFLWHNRGDGSFREDGLVAGAALDANGVAEAGMGVLADDLDGDGRLDLFTTNLTNETVTFYRNLGAGSFADATNSAGLAAATMPYTGFGTVALDADLDGDLDLLVVNGRVTRDDDRVTASSHRDPFWGVYAEPNLFFVNDGAGHFVEMAQEGGAFCAEPHVSRALAVGDLDGDGDLDALVNSLDGPARVFRNDAPRRGRWLLVRALDPALRRDAIGARLTLTTGGRTQIRTIKCASSYLSSSDPRAHFGLGAAESIDDLVVAWPDGSRERFAVEALDRAITVERGGGVSVP